MKKIISFVACVLVLAFAVTPFNAAVVVVGGSDEKSTYTVEHYLESHYSLGNNLSLEQTFEGTVGRTTNAKAVNFLGYTADSNFKQSYITSNDSTKVAINYTMDGFDVGDVNCDGYIDLLDSAILQRKIAEWENYDHEKVCIYTSDIYSDGDTTALDTLMLMNMLADNPTEEAQRVEVKLNIHGTVTSYELVAGTKLSTPDAIIFDDLQRYTFDGWYDSTFTQKYEVVPNTPTTLYAKYNNYTLFNFESGTHFDPNNQQRFSVIDNPYGDGKVISSLVSDNTSSNNSVNGTLRGFNPGIYDGIETEGYKGIKGKTYTVSFKYRYLNTDASGTKCSFMVYGCNAAGIGATGNKTTSPILTNKSSSYGEDILPIKSDWANYSATFDYSVDYTYLYFRYAGKSATPNTIYIDDFTIIEHPDSAITLNINGQTEATTLAVGDKLPVLDAVSDPLTESEFGFKGWYDETLTTAYTTVSANVDTYYAVFENYTFFGFETGGMYDPNNRYTGNTQGTYACWNRTVDPTDKNNICLRANLTESALNTHFAFSVYDGISSGYKLTSGNRYFVTYDYIVVSSGNAPEEISAGLMCAKQENIGTSGGKGNHVIANFVNTGKWEKAVVSFTANAAVEYPYLIMFAQASMSKENTYPDLNVYIDNIEIRSYNEEYTFKVATLVDNITFNENGNINADNTMYIGEKMPSAPEYYGAEFINWYDSKMMTPYITVPKGETEFRAKYDADIINFSNGGYFDPNNNFGSGLSKYSLTTSPTDRSNKVMKIDFSKDGNTHHFALNKSGYNNTDGYKLTVGNTYEISFMYYAENLSENGVNVHFRGASSDSIGVIGGKSSAYGSKDLTEEGMWTGVTVSFTYSGGVDGDNYLMFLAQDKAYSLGDDACESVVYFDDIVIKETEPETTYASKTIKFNGRRPGDTYGYWFSTGTRKLNIVIPDYNFSYIARMQLDNLVSVYSKITGQTPQIVKESSWNDSGDYHCNIFVGDVKGDSSDRAAYRISSSSLSADDYAYNFGNCNVYINGGSTYALAMAISEFTNTLINCESNTDFQPGLSFSGKYSEKIDSYSSKDYYKPSFLEDFSGTEINTKVWDCIDKDNPQYSSPSVTEGKTSVRSAEHTSIEDDKLVINGDFDDNYYYGGMLRSHGKLQYKYGYMEVSCILPEGAGLWTATWLTPTTNEGLMYGEIDVNESYGDSSKTGFNVHLWPTTAGVRWGEQKKSPSGSFESKATSGKTFNDEFHTYGFLWTEDKFIATLDGSVINTYTFNMDEPDDNDNTNLRYDAFSDYMSLIISMTVGNPSVPASSDLDESADYWNTTNKYIVDYVHIYQIDGQDIIFTEAE